MLGSVGDFIRRFVVCTDYQAVVLTAWVLHTWCYRAFATTPYLNIISPGPHCGKTRLLQVLQLLSPPGSWFTSSPAPQLFMRKLLALKPAAPEVKERVHDLPSAVFLDDREFTIGSSNRHPIVPFLNSGFRASNRYLYQLERSSIREFSVFCPKAFAGDEPLPGSLASRCIPIRLQRKKDSEKVEPLDFSRASLDAAPLTAWMDQWSKENFKTLAARAHRYAMEHERGTLRQRELAKPLLLIADCIGGSWLQNVSNSLLWLAPSLDPDGLDQRLQLLTDLRQAFQMNSSPAYIATRDLIPYLRQLEYRSWSKWGRGSAHELASLLRPFGICSKDQRISPNSVIKVYFQEDLENAWSRYL